MFKNNINKTHLLIFLAVLSSGTLLIANLSATKLWSFFGVVVDGGIIIFPLSYVINDLIMEFYGDKISKKVTYAGFLINLIATLTFFSVSILPAHPDWPNQSAFASIFNSTPRIVAASLAAYLVSQLINIYFFEKIRQKTKGKYLIFRTIGSSVVARFFDVVIFIGIAFFGVIPLSSLLAQIIFAYISGMLLESLLSPITVISVKVLRKKLSSR